MICKRGLLWLTCSFFLGTWAHAGVVYQNDFESQAVGTEWLGASLTTTPSGCTRCTSFLGEFLNQAVVLRLLNLPLHVSATLDFDLYVIRSWDGNIGQFGGPDIFGVSDSTNSLSFQSTFSNNWPFGSQFNQAFPGVYPGGVFPSQAGAVETQTLGYIFDANPVGTVPMDAVYHLNFTFAHSDPALTIFFEAQNLTSLADESWGLDNVSVSVSVIPEPSSAALLLAGLTLLAVRWNKLSDSFRLARTAGMGRFVEFAGDGSSRPPVVG
jgi:hypothetical protein